MSKFFALFKRTPAPAPAPVIPIGDNKPSNEQVLRDLAVSLAAEDVGQRETQGNNRSPFIDALAKRAGVPYGTPWCALGLSIRVYQRLCEQQNLKNPLGITASSQDIASLVPHKYWRSRAKHGDAFVLTKRNDSAHGHTGLVEHDMTGDAYFDTIEYNTNKFGSRDGDGCYRQRRSTKGDLTKRLRCFVDVIQFIMDENGLS